LIKYDYSNCANGTAVTTLLCLVWSTKIEAANVFPSQCVCMFLKQKIKIGREPTRDKAVQTATMYRVREQS